MTSNYVTPTYYTSSEGSIFRKWFYGNVSLTRLEDLLECRTDAVIINGIVVHSIIICDLNDHREERRWDCKNGWGTVQRYTKATLDTELSRWKRLRERCFAYHYSEKKASIYEIAKMFSVSPTTVRAVLKSAGCKMRPCGCNNKNKEPVE